LRLNPADYQGHFGIGNMLLKLGQPAEALAEYRQCLTLHPDDPVYHNAAAGALAAQGDLAAALQEYAEAERLDPHYAEPHLELAKIYFQGGHDAQARDELQAAVGAAPYDVLTFVTAAHDLAANANDSARDPQSAVALALKANDLSGNREPEVFDVLGMAFAATGDFSNAVICAQNALDFTPAAVLKDAGPIRQRLELYQNQKPWRESFLATNVPVTP
jgi:tetratricopeptide (TPR) repeat protein